MIEKLETQINQLQTGNVSAIMDIAPSETLKKTENELRQVKEDCDKLEKALETVQNERDHLKYELNRRAMKGDYDPTDTKVIHFK